MISAPRTCAPHILRSEARAKVTVGQGTADVFDGCLRRTYASADCGIDDASDRGLVARRLPSGLSGCSCSCGCWQRKACPGGYATSSMTTIRDFCVVVQAP